MSLRRGSLVGIAVVGGLAAGLFTASVARTRGGDGQELVVFAAASLREVFQKLAEDFENRHPGVEVRLNFAGSQELRVQIEHGAKADIFAPADGKSMRALQDKRLVSEAWLFARNGLVVIVPAANPAKLATFVDLARAGSIVVGGPEVPVGAYTERMLLNAEKPYGAKFHEAVVAHIRSRELNVRQVLTKVSLGEADAGIVYRTDALSARDKVTAIEIPDAVNVIADYPIAVPLAAAHPDLAREWLATALGPEGQRALRIVGFRTAHDAGREPVGR